MKWLFAGLLAAPPALAADIVSAYYDARADAIFVQVAYRGTHEKHRFQVEWAPCREGPSHHVSGRLFDVYGRDLAQESFRVIERIDLDELPCRPASVTLRLGRVSHTTLHVPAKPAQ